MGRGVGLWQAKAKFSEIIERAMSEGSQTITRKGRTAALVVGAEEWQRKTKRAGLKVRRLKAPLRRINL